jgi:hypothetical protein
MLTQFLPIDDSFNRLKPYTIAFSVMSSVDES